MHHAYMHHMYKCTSFLHINLGYMHNRYTHHGNMHDIEVEKEVVVTFAWVTRPERPKGAKDEVKRPEGPSS